MRFGSTLVLAAGLMVSTTAASFDIGLVPLHDFFDQEGKPCGRNISLQGSSRQVAKMRRWLEQIAAVPKGHETLVRIDRSGHKLMIHHSPMRCT